MATKILIEITGLVLLAWSLKVLLQFFTKPIAVFRFEDATHQFEIGKPGYYSISVLGAGFIHLVQRVAIKITSDNDDGSNVRIHHVTFFSTTEGRKEIHCWGFSISHAGNYILSISNLDQIDAYSSMLRSKRIFESPIDHSKLRILIHQSVKPAYQLAAILALILGTNLIFHGIFNL
jgi:hypothetical protein